MSTLKSVIITLPKSLTKAPGGVNTCELKANNSNLNFTTSILAASDTNKMVECRKSIMRQLEDSMSMDEDLVKPDGWLRGKKRRLDHLTWEEKLQRKKLKNRVAAQTSRDRKKAKLDELEDTVRALRDSNDLLTEECGLLRSQNESLLTEAKRLKRERDEVKASTKATDERYCSTCQVRVGCAAPTLGSAAGWGSPAGTVPDNVEPKRLDNPEDHDSLPPLEELFGELQGDDYIERLEELAKSLLREVTTEVEASSCRANEQITIKQDTTEEPNDPEGVVGPSPENVETRPAVGSLNDAYPDKHNRVVVPPATSATSASPVNCTKTNVSNSTTRSDSSSRQISKIPAETPNFPFKSEIEVKEEPSTDMDTVYGTYDEATNCITIIYPGENDGVQIQECVQEVCSTDNSAGDEMSPTCQPYNILGRAHARKNSRIVNNGLLSPAYTFADSLSSPSSINSEDSDVGITNSYKLESNLSDCGYESHDSPAHARFVNGEINLNVGQSAASANCANGATALTDLWHESFSELFPSLA